MDLQLPPEPINQKQERKEELEKGESRTNPARMNVKQGTFISSYLWLECGWKNLITIIEEKSLIAMGIE